MSAARSPPAPAGHDKSAAPVPYHSSRAQSPRCQLHFSYEYLPLMFESNCIIRVYIQWGKTANAGIPFPQTGCLVERHLSPLSPLGTLVSVVYVVSALTKPTCKRLHPRPYGGVHSQGWRAIILALLPHWRARENPRTLPDGASSHSERRTPLLSDKPTPCASENRTRRCKSRCEQSRPWEESHSSPDCSSLCRRVCAARSVSRQRSSVRVARQMAHAPAPQDVLGHTH